MSSETLMCRADYDARLGEILAIDQEQQTAQTQQLQELGYVAVFGVTGDTNIFWSEFRHKLQKGDHIAPYNIHRSDGNAIDGIAVWRKQP
jgi:hypothetical protein